MQKFKLEQVSNQLDNSELENEIFITCVSFEDRCLAPITYLKKCLGAIIIQNKENKNINCVNNTDKLYGYFSGICKNTEVIESSYINLKLQNISQKKIVDICMSKCDKSKINITIDSSTFTRNQLIGLLNYLEVKLSPSRVRIIYTSPLKHGEWLTSGFLKITNVIGFSGIHNPLLPTLLIVLSGFESDRVSKIICEHEPALVLLGVGDPPINEEFHNRNIKEQQQILDNEIVNEFKFPANDIKACKNELDKQISKYRNEYNIVIAPMSTKLSTIAAYLSAKENPQIQITYCYPSIYNFDDYSSGIGEVYLENLESNCIKYNECCGC
ncbi:hypothetical protein [Clostridium butyricum]|uniref:hypothetical protein n=1 Tax=Clostridium butyricum TaxID=1492 RepID=UPI00374F791E